MIKLDAGKRCADANTLASKWTSADGRYLALPAAISSMLQWCTLRLFK